MNLRDALLRIRALAAPYRVEQELDGELAFHIERETQKHIAAGLSPADARSRAIARFGPVPLAADFRWRRQKRLTLASAFHCRSIAATS